ADSRAARPGGEAPGGSPLTRPPAAPAPVIVAEPRKCVLGCPVMALHEDLRKELDQIIQGNQVVLFMKGTRDEPACGFSAAVTDGGLVRFEVDARFNYGLSFDQPQPTDLRVQAGSIELVIDRGSARRADATVIDFVDRPGGGGFRIDNPNEPPRVKPISAA